MISLKLIRKKYSLLLLLVVFILPINSLARQNEKKSKQLFEKALSGYYLRNYQDSFALLIESIDNDSTNINAYLLLSDVCIELKQTEKRIVALQKVIELDPLKNVTAFKFIAQAYFDQGEYDYALNNFQKYRNYSTLNDSLEIDKWIKRSSFCKGMIENKTTTKIIHLDSTINTLQNEYWPAISVDDSIFYFTRLIADTPDYPYERIYYSKRINNKWDVASELKIGAEGLENEGSLCFSANGEFLFFTACGRPDGFGSCDIYYSQKIDGNWTTPRNAGNTLNSAKWEAQPSMSSDGTTLFFASNRNGGKGKKDIWVSKINYSKQRDLYFTPPVNAGYEINTIENDFSPFIHADNHTLYFASDGRLGLGRTDLFFSRIKDNTWTVAENMGYPINSRFEDDGLVVSPTANLALFSSNRENSINGSKDLYQFELPDDFLPEKMGYIKGFVFNNETQQKINGIIEFVELNSGEPQNIRSSSSNGYTALIKANSLYSLNVCEPGYLIFSRHFDLQNPDNFREATLLDIFLEPITVGDRVELKNIFFDFDSFTLKKESIIELQQVVHFLTMNPSVKIEISGHTDNIGSSVYNLKLSEERAKAIFEWLIQHITSDRINFVGYGSTMPVDSNETVEGRIRNRRSELRIIAY